MARDRHQLTTVVVGDEPGSWATAGFTVHDDRVRIGSTTIVCDPGVGYGIATVGIDGLTDTVDGLPIGLVEAPVTPAAEHDNRVTGFDHLVAMSPSIDRTAGRRSMPACNGAEPAASRWAARPADRTSSLVMSFSNSSGSTVPGAGDDILGPALECDDLGFAARRLGEALGTVKDAVQPGRRTRRCEPRNSASRYRSP